MQANFAELFERWQVVEEIDAQALLLIKDTACFAAKTDVNTLRDRANELLAGAYLLPTTPKEIALVKEAMEGTGVVAPEIPPEDNGWGDF